MSLEFYTELNDLQIERDAAFATRQDDPDRWNAAKTAYALWRRGIRSLAGRTVAAGGAATASASDAIVNVEEN